MSPSKAVFLEWKDSTSGQGWQPANSEQAVDLRCVSIGLIVREDEEKITISTSRAGLSRSRDFFVDQLTIPKSAILRRRPVRLPLGPKG